MMTLEEVHAALQDRVLSKVARSVGIDYRTVLRIKNGGSATYDTIKKISDYLEGVSNGK